MTTHPYLLDKQPFIVPQSDLMFWQATSPNPNTVLTLERDLYAWTIYEYTDPLSRSRQWMYADKQDQETDFLFALHSLFDYLFNPDNTTEPPDWTRAIDFPNGKLRTRRLHTYADGSTSISDSTHEEPQP